MPDNTRWTINNADTDIELLAKQLLKRASEGSTIFHEISSSGRSLRRALLSWLTKLPHRTFSSSLHPRERMRSPSTRCWIIMHRCGASWIHLISPVLHCLCFQSSLLLLSTSLMMMFDTTPVPFHIKTRTQQLDFDVPVRHKEMVASTATYFRC